MLCMARSSRPDVTPWAELKAVALMTPLPRVLLGPITPGWLLRIAIDIEVDLDVGYGEYQMLPVVIHLARAPMPLGWRLMTVQELARDGPPKRRPKDPRLEMALLTRRNTSIMDRDDRDRLIEVLASPERDDHFVRGKGERGPPHTLHRSKDELTSRRISAKLMSSKEISYTKPASLKDVTAGLVSPREEIASRRAVLNSKDDVSSQDIELARSMAAQHLFYINDATGERCAGHPGASMVMQAVNGFRVRAQRQKPSPFNDWVQFSNGSSNIYFHDFGSASDMQEFPVFERKVLKGSALPYRKLEPSAQLLAATGVKLAQEAAQEAGGTDNSEFIRILKSRLFTPCFGARAAHLAHTPCPVVELVQEAFYLGLDPVAHHKFMWLIDAALAPIIPVGWMRRSVQADEEFFWNALCGMAQWEHPQVSIIAGVIEYVRENVHHVEDSQNHGGYK